MKASQQGRRYDAKATAEHFGRARLRPETQDIPLDAADRNVIPNACCCDPRKWFIVATVPQGERACGKSLRSAGVSAYVPCETFWRRSERFGRVINREFGRPILRGYTFIGHCGADEDWDKVRRRDAWNRNAHGIVGILTMDGKPWPLLGRWLGSMIALAAEEEFGWYDETKLASMPREKARPHFMVGENALVQSGPFTGFEGIVTRDSRNGDVEIETMVFGRATPIMLPVDQALNLTRPPQEKATILRRA